MTLVFGMQPITSGSFSSLGVGIGNGSGGGDITMPSTIPQYALTIINFTRLEFSQAKTFTLAGVSIAFPAAAPGTFTWPRAYYLTAQAAYNYLFTWNAGGNSTTVWWTGTYAIYKNVSGLL